MSHCSKLIPNFFTGCIFPAELLVFFHELGKGNFGHEVFMTKTRVFRCIAHIQQILNSQVDGLWFPSGNIEDQVFNESVRIKSNTKFVYF